MFLCQSYNCILRYCAKCTSVITKVTVNAAMKSMDMTNISLCKKRRKVHPIIYMSQLRAQRGEGVVVVLPIFHCHPCLAVL